MHVYLLASPPPYIALNSPHVALMFAVCAALPVVAVAMWRRRIPRAAGYAALFVQFLLLIPIGLKLPQLANHAAASYWATWCTTIIVVSTTSSLLLIPKKPGMP